MIILRSAQLSRALASRGFSISATSRLGLKESSSQTDYDRHKQDSLTKQKKGIGHWKPELASDSEEAVRADRAAAAAAELADVKEALRKLQERTKRAAEELAKAGTSMREYM
ncbi:hypothetical protein B0J13DRAFT_586209 [Dactylonectria estremocensis]|uniref:Mitochondrial ATPase inhibitor n=1 Tax=Dactylonectria estremocensis TaxID=1079267 RepID=A0A9P9ENW1_9HYPO|nr:hypothetical protein B0J13DRAFT_586209 [Dactylonectria estremocensis]